MFETFFINAVLRLPCKVYPRNEQMRMLQMNQGLQGESLDVGIHD